MHIDHKQNARRIMTRIKACNNSDSCLQSSKRPLSLSTSLQQSKSREIISDRIEGLLSQEKSKAYAIKDYLRDFDSGSVAEPVDAVCRSKMAEWLYICITTLRLRRSVIPVAFSYVDRFLSAAENSDNIDAVLRDRSKYQLLVITCLYVAVKLTEERVLSPSILSKLSQGRYSEQDIEEEELRVLKTLGWRLAGPTTSEFVRHFLALDISEAEESAAGLTIEAISRTQAELSVSDQSLVSVPYSTLALASIRNAMEDVGYLAPQERTNSLAKLAALVDVDPFSQEVEDAMSSLKKMERDSAIGTALSLLSSDLVCHKRHKVSRVISSPTSVSRAVAAL